MTEFKEYRQLKQELSNELSAMVKPMHKELLEAQNDARIKQEEMNDKIDKILEHKMFKAWDVTTSGFMMFKYVGLFLLFVGAVIGSIKLLGVEFFEFIRRHI